MGWGCTQEAGRTMDAFKRVVCVEMQNVWANNGDYFFWDSGREQTDGAITGTVYKMLSDNRCRRLGGVRIEPDGTITRWAGTSASMRRMVMEARR